METDVLRPTLLDVPISFFEYDHQRSSFANVPAQQTTLRRMAATKYYRSQIEAIRAEEDEKEQKELKKQLPAFTPVALLHHRKKDTSFDEKIRQQWPLLMGDIDAKDNPGIDMAELKQHLTRLPYVLLCAYSVRGGLWFVVRLPDGQTPETLEAHFRYLQKLFSSFFGITLDSSKGGNPTHLRFVSYDAAPYLNDSATAMAGTYTPPKPQPKAARTYSYTRTQAEQDSELLTRLVRFAEAAPDGQRHEILLKAATVAGGFIAAGRMDEQTAVYGLETVASEWPNFSKSQKTIRDGIRYGKLKPIYPEYREPRQYAPAPISRPAVNRSKAEALNYEVADTYPPEWDEPGQPTHRLVPSPRRSQIAELLGIPADKVKLWSLAPIS
ncbi:hypothetical protein GCM10023187_48460 [Nibrella viscosa]|uniref:Virulence-protein E N-terminal domain-containing protein n=1 Tax=Nibrella viscosa TaxID=1084524 RepID=A0ABP8KUU2_9BACT